MALDETAYRSLIQSTFDRIESAFESIDPDLVECTQSFGALTLVLGSGPRCILSAQPSVRQLWLALAAQGTAIHFNWDEESLRWVDDKGQGVELITFLEKYLSRAAKIAISLS